MIDSRDTEDGRSRRRKCLSCGERWSTLETRTTRAKPNIGATLKKLRHLQAEAAAQVELLSAETEVHDG